MHMEKESYKVYALKLPSNLDFSGEAVPLDQPDIRERLDKELLVNTYWQSNMMLLLKRANKYFPTIELILEEGCSDDFKYLAVIESALENVRSQSKRLLANYARNCKRIWFGSQFKRR